MKLSDQELSKLIGYTDVFRKDCERNIRRIRRNFDHINEQFNSTPEEIALESGITSPADDIEHLKGLKAESVIIKKKLILARK